jgi:hypothetical protein
MNTIEINDIFGNPVLAKVGDTIAGYCYLHKGIISGEIEKIKSGFRASGFKITPKAKECVFISAPEPLKQYPYAFNIKDGKGNMVSTTVGDTIAVYCPVVKKMRLTVVDQVIGKHFVEATGAAYLYYKCLFISADPHA